MLFMSCVFFKAFALFLCLSIGAAFAAEPQAPNEAGAPVPTIGEVFAGEELKYDISFWFFNQVAESRISIKEDGPGRYVAVLSAKTNGLLDTILRHRRDRYIARLRLSDDGKRFLTDTFEKEVEIKGKGTRRSIHTVDYNARTVSWRSWGAGKPERSGVDKIPDGMFTDDPIAAFYNFRFGVYGDITEGRDYRIITFPKEDKLPEISIRIANGKELRKRHGSGVAADLLADARLDKELFGSKDGDIEILFTRDMLPVQAIAKGITFFGDVKGKLKEVVAGGLKRPSN